MKKRLKIVFLILGISYALYTSVYAIEAPHSLSKELTYSTSTDILLKADIAAASFYESGLLFLIGSGMIGLAMYGRKRFSSRK